LVIAGIPAIRDQARRKRDHRSGRSATPSHTRSLQLVKNGGLVGYGVDFNAMWRRAAYFVVKIFKGANPGDLPIEQATHFHTIVNLKTAKTIGVDIPPLLLATANEVIE
jgi:putative tryptophan/tyrosine transport system substrate-binding protein